MLFMEPIKEFSHIVLSLDNCIIPDERLCNTPSFKDGMDHDLEVDIRITGCEFIQSAGLLLKLPQAAMATAQILFHRFYYAKSFVKFNCYYSLMACLFLAAKLEECNRRLRDVINVFHHLKQKRKGSTPVPMDYVGEEYYRLRNTINKYERYILKELGFCVHVQHPHKLIMTCLQILQLEKNKTLAQRAWNFMNDGLRTNIFVRFPIPTIACACIFLAARELQIPLPRNPSWWQLLDVPYKDMKTISLELLALYKRPKQSFVELEKRVEEVKQLLLTKGEIKVTKDEATPPSQTASPRAVSPAALLSVDSNVATQKTSPGTKIGISPLVDSIKDTAHTNDTTKNKESPVNGHKHARSDSPSPGEKRLKLSEKKDGQPIKDQSFRPILSPIKLTSSSDEGGTMSEGGAGTRVNGLPSQYQLSPDIETSKHHSHKHRSRKHRSEKHRRHARDRSRSPVRERSRDHIKHSRHHSREERDRERGREVVRTISSRDYDSRDYSRHHNR